MAWQYTPYTIPLVLAGTISGALTLYIWRRRRPPESRAMIILALAVAIWSLTYALQLASATLSAQVFWSKAQYVGIATVPSAWLAFALQYVTQGRWPTRRGTALLAIEPLITVILAWTNEAHGLIWSSYRFETFGTFSMKVSTHGIWFWVHIEYTYLIVLIGSVLALRFMRSHRLYREQALALLMLALVPTAGNMLYLSRLNPFHPLDPTSFAFALITPVMIWSLFRLRLGDILPVVYASVIEGMNDGVIVLDTQNRILEMNPAAQKLVNCDTSQIIGQSIDQVASAFAQQMGMLDSEIAGGKEIVLGKEELRRIYDARLSFLTNRRGRLTSKVVTLRDITERKWTEEALRKHREQLEDMVRDRTVELTAANKRLMQEIVDRKCAEETLRLSEERHRQILDTSDDGVYVVDENANILFANRAWRQSTGFAPDEVKDGFDLIHPEDRERIAAYLQRALAGESMRHVEYRGLTKDGRFRWVEANTDLINWPGAQQALLVITRDITQRKQMEEALRLSEDRYHQILDSSHDVITVFDENLQLLYANKALHEEIGYTLEELNDLKIYRTRHPDDLERFRELFAKVMSGEPAHNFAFRRINKNGEIRWVESNMGPVHWAGTQRAFMSVARDVTESKRAEQALKESEERYRTLVDNSLTGIFVGQDGKLPFANKRVCELTGYTLEELTEQPFEHLVHPDDRELIRQIIARRLSGQDPAGRYEYRVIKKDGGIIWLESIGTLIQYQGKPAILANVIDITERKQMEEELRLSEERYRQTLNASHDLIIVMDENLKVLFANKALQDTGYTVDDINAVGILQAIHPDDRERALLLGEQAIAGKPVRKFECRRFNKNGELRWGEANIDPVLWTGAKAAIVAVIRDVTESKRAEQALKESEERYRSVVDNSLTGIFVGQDGKLPFVNKRVCELIGYTCEELTEQPYEHLVHPDDREFVHDVVARRYSGQDHEERYEYRVVKKDGGIIWLEWFGTPIQYRGRPAILANVIDITERKRMQEELRLSEERYRRILDASEDRVLVMDDAAQILYANRGWEEYGGRKINELNAIDIFATVHEKHREALRSAFHKVLSGEAIRNFQYLGIHVSGEPHWLEANAAPIDWPGTERAVACVVRDITDRKQAEEALRESEERYRTLIDSSLTGIYVAYEGIIQFVNDQFCTLSGYTREELLGTSVTDLLHPDDREILLELRRRWMSGREPAKPYHFRMLHKNGNVKWIEAVGTRVDYRGRPAVMTNLIDITEQKSMEDALREEKEKAQKYLDIAGVMLVVLGADEKVTLINKKGCEVLGYSEAEILGKNWFDNFLPVHVRDDVRVVFHRLMAGELKLAEYYENPVLTAGGQERYIAWRNTAFTDDAGNILSILSSGGDITERKQALEALRLSEARYRTLFEDSPVALSEEDYSEVKSYIERLRDSGVKDFRAYFDNHPEAVVECLALVKQLDVNRHILELHEATRKEEITKHFESVFAEETYDLFKEGLVSIAQGERVFEREGLAKTLTGKKRNIILRRTVSPGCEESLASLMVSVIDITARKRTEEALRASEEKYRNIFEEAPDIFYTLDLETWMITDANKYALEVFEYSPELLGKMHITDLIHPDDYEAASKRLRDMVTNKDRMPNFPLRVLTRAGKVTYIEQSGVIFWDEEGHAKTFLGLARDVTERKQQEEMIRKRNKSLAALYEVAKVGNESLDLNSLLNQLLEIVPRVTDSDAMAIFSLDETTQTMKNIAHCGLSDKFVRESDNFGTEERVLSLMTRNRVPLLFENVQERPLLTRRSTQKKEGIESVIMAPLVARNKLTGVIFVSRKPGNPYNREDLEVVAGMASQIAAAIENANLYSQILDREKHLNSILETSRDGIVVSLGTGGVVYRNSAISSMFGYSDEDNVGDTDTMNYFAPESHEVLSRIRQQLDRREDIDKIVDFKGKRKDGSTFDAELRLSYFFEGDNRFDVGVVRDVTERKRMEYQLMQSSKLAAIGQLAAGVAHEINNPIAAIDTYTGLLKDIVLEESDRRADSSLEPARKYLAIIENQVRRCQSVTGQLLTFSRIPQGKMEVFSINELVKETVEMMVHLTNKRPEVKKILDEKIPHFKGDPHRLQQVFVNLLNNAFEAIAPRGSVTIVTNRDENGDIRIEFRDTGSGIPSEIKDRIFDPFFTTRADGTGLGLSISYYIIKQNGTIDVESAPGHGTTFTITLGEKSRTMMEDIDHVS